MCVEASTMKIKVSAGGFFLLNKELLFSVNVHLTYFFGIMYFCVCLQSVASCTVNVAILMQSYIADL